MIAADEFHCTATALPLQTRHRGRGRARVQAGYTVHLVIVLATLETCWRRIEERRLERGRSVPFSLAQATSISLRRALRLYLSSSAELAETALVYDNDREALAPLGTTRPEADPSFVTSFGLGTTRDGRPLLKTAQSGYPVVLPEFGGPEMSSKHAWDDDDGPVRGPGTLLTHLRRSSTQAERQAAGEQAMRFLESAENAMV